MRVDAYKERQALVAKSEQSDYAFFASEGRLEFIVFMEGTGYVGAALDPSQALPTKWAGHTENSAAIRSTSLSLIVFQRVRNI